MSNKDIRKTALVDFAESILGIDYLTPAQKNMLRAIATGEPINFKIIPKRGTDPTVRRIVNFYANQFTQQLRASTQFLFYWDPQEGWIHVSETEKIREAYERFKTEKLSDLDSYTASLDGMCGAFGCSKPATHSHTLDEHWTFKLCEEHYAVFKEPTK